MSLDLRQRYPEGFARLLTALEERLTTPKPITFYGPRPYVPASDIDPNHKEPKKRACLICGGGTKKIAGRANGVDSDALVCGGCHRTSQYQQARCDSQLRRDTQRRLLAQANRNKTSGTPVPAILQEADATS